MVHKYRDTGLRRWTYSHIFKITAFALALQHFWILWKLRFCNIRHRKNVIISETKYHHVMTNNYQLSMKSYYKVCSTLSPLVSHNNPKSHLSTTPSSWSLSSRLFCRIAGMIQTLPRRKSRKLILKMTHSFVRLVSVINERYHADSLLIS